MYADRSDKWHHTMARYMGLPLDTSFLFGILPGVCREAIGRYDHMYTKRECFNSDKVYAWSKKHAEKINSAKFSNTKAYYGTAPFLWELGRVASKNNYESNGSLFFLPRDDQCTIREDEHESVQELIATVPRPLTFLLPWRSCDIWKHWNKIELPKDSNFVQMSDPVVRQETLSRLYLSHDNVYVPWPGTDIYYAEYLDKNVIVYDKLEQYRTKVKGEMDRWNNTVIHYLKWGYNWLNENQRVFFEWTRDWNNIDRPVRKNLTNIMLGIDALKSPEELHDDMMSQGYFEPHQKFRYNSEYQESYEWLSNREKNHDHLLLDHPHIALL